MGEYKWKKEGRYFKGLCTNSVLSTPSQRQGVVIPCGVCVDPVFNEIPQNDCNPVMLLEERSPYIWSVDPFSMSLDYSGASSVTQFTSIQGPQSAISLGPMYPVNDRSFFSTIIGPGLTRSSYINRYKPSQLFPLMRISETFRFSYRARPQITSVSPGTQIATGCGISTPSSLTTSRTAVQEVRSTLPAIADGYEILLDPNPMVTDKKVVPDVFVERATFSEQVIANITASITAVRIPNLNNPKDGKDYVFTVEVGASHNSWLGVSATFSLRNPVEQSQIIPGTPASYSLPVPFSITHLGRGGPVASASARYRLGPISQAEFFSKSAFVLPLVQSSGGWGATGTGPVGGSIDQITFSVADGSNRRGFAAPVSVPQEIVMRLAKAT